MANFSNIKIKKINKDIVSIIIDEPKTYNALSFKNLSDLIKIFKKLDIDKNIKVIIIEGSGIPEPSMIITLIFLSISNFLNILIKSLKFLNESALYVFGSSIIIDTISLLIFFILILLKFAIFSHFSSNFCC